MPPKKILIVDDDERLRNLYTELLRAEKFNVEGAENGERALALLQAGPLPDIILTGIVMHVIGGFDLIIKLKNDPRYKDIPIAMISHRGLPEDEKRARDLNVLDFIPQYKTPPPEVIRRIKLLLGFQNSFTLMLSPDLSANRAFIDFLNTQQASHCKIDALKDITLEVKAGTQKGEFNITLIC